MFAVFGGLTVWVRSSTWNSTFFVFNPCIPAYELPSLADNSTSVACTKRDVVNSCLAKPDNEAVIHSATCTTNL